MKTKYKILLILTLHFALCTLHLRQAHAQSIDLGIWPPILQVMIQPGKAITQVYKMTNFGDPAIISSKVVPFSPLGNQGSIELVDCKKIEVIGCESLSWFSFQNADLDVGKPFFSGSGRVQEVILKITVPETASEGDYYNTLLFTSQAPSGLGEKRTRATSSIGSNILITVSKDGNPTRDIQIVEFSAKNRLTVFGLPITLSLFDSFQPIPATLQMQNTGSAYTAVSGKITLTGFPGLQSKFTVSPQNILSGSTRLLSATPSAELSSLNASRLFTRRSLGEGGPLPASLVLPQGFYLGRYTLEAKVENDNGITKLAKISFYALPIKIIFWVIVTILIILSFFQIRKKLRRK